MNDRTSEILKKLQRLSNDRAIPRLARNHIQEAANYIKLQHEQMAQLESLVTEPGSAATTSQ